MTAASRILRTLFQVVLAVGAAIPAAVALLDLSAETTAKVVGIAGATVVIVTAIQNALEAKRLVPTMLARGDVGTTTNVFVNAPAADDIPSVGSPKRDALGRFTDAGQSYGLVIVVLLVLILVVLL